MNTNNEVEQPESRGRVLAVFQAHVGVWLKSSDLCALAKTNAAVRREWELSNFYGYVIIGLKEGRNQWSWQYVRAEPWALDPSVSVPMARAIERARLEALKADTAPARVNMPTGQIGLGL